MRVVHVVGPVVVVVCPPRLDEGFVQELAGSFEPILSGDRRFACITETAAIGELPDAKNRKRLAQWMNRGDVRERQKGLNVGSSTLIYNGAMRAVATALYWLWTPPTPQHAAGSTDEALDWSLAQLSASGTRFEEPEGAIRARVRFLCGSRSTQPPPPPP